VASKFAASLSKGYRMVFKNGKWVRVPVGSSVTSSIPRPQGSAEFRAFASDPSLSRSVPSLQERNFLIDQSPRVFKTKPADKVKVASGIHATAPELDKELISEPAPIIIPPVTKPPVEDKPVDDTVVTPDTPVGPAPLPSDWQPASDIELFGYDPVTGGRRSVVGDLQAQLGAWNALVGTFRQGYNWYNEGTPQTPKEAWMFLEQARGDPLNQITFTQISDTSSMVTRALKVISNAESGYGPGGGEINQELLRKAKEIKRINDYEGGRLYTRGGELVEDPDDRANYDKMVSFKARAQSLIDNYRVGRENLFASAIEQGYAKDLVETTGVSAKAVAKIQKESAKAVADINAQADKDVAAIQKEIAEAQLTTQTEISAAEVTGREAVAKVQATGAKDVAIEQSKGALEAAKERSKGGLEVSKEQSRSAKEVETARGTNEVTNIQERAKQDIANIEAKAESDMNLLTEEMTTRERMAMTEQTAALERITRESTAQQALVQLGADLDMELETSKQNWQSAENDKELAIQEGNLQEAIRSNFMQEQIAIEQQQIERETNSLTMLMNVSQNPALLYFMKQSGMLSGVGPSLLGQDTESLINDLTASIDPGNLPNIQTYNAMSELQQQIASFRTGATTGMSPEAQQEYLLGASPFTRGQRSSIRVGSRANPFATMA
jgi:hypothetical protein